MCELRVPTIEDASLKMSLGSRITLFRMGSCRITLLVQSNIFINTNVSEQQHCGKFWT